MGTDQADALIPLKQFITQGEIMKKSIFVYFLVKGLINLLNFKLSFLQFNLKGFYTK